MKKKPTAAEREIALATQIEALAATIEPMTAAVEAVKRGIDDALRAGRDTAALRQRLARDERALASARAGLEGLKQSRQAIAGEVRDERARALLEAAEAARSGMMQKFYIPELGDRPC